MPQPKKGPRLGAGPSHQSLMLRNLARSLFAHERIQTTEAKAKMLRPFAERLISKAKTASVHSRRQVLSEIADREVTHKLFEDIAPRFTDRPGGYTRVLKLGPRGGDGAPMAIVELVTEGVAAVAAAEETSTRRRGRRGGRRTPAGAPSGERTEDVTEKTDERTAPAEDQTEAEEAGEAGAAPGDADSETTQDTPGPEAALATEKPPSQGPVAKDAPEVASGSEEGIEDKK